MQIIVSGASGLIGSQLVSFLEAGGASVVRLVRPPATLGPGEAAWDPAARNRIGSSQLLSAAGDAPLVRITRLRPLSLTTESGGAYAFNADRRHRHLVTAIHHYVTSADTDRIPVSSGILSIEGDHIDPEGDGCVRGRLAFVRDGVLVQGQFLTNPCWNF